MVEIRSCRVSSSRALLDRFAHAVEGLRQAAEFVSAAHIHSIAVVLARDFGGRSIEFRHRTHDAAGDEIGHQQRGEHG